jgi:hypothetical protein
MKNCLAYFAATDKIIAEMIIVHKMSVDRMSRQDI